MCELVCLNRRPRPPRGAQFRLTQPLPPWQPAKFQGPVRRRPCRPLTLRPASVAPTCEGNTAVFSFINAWNEFLYAAVLTGNQTRTVTVALFGFISTEEHLWGAFTASGTMIMVPVIVLALAAQRHIVHGLTLGAVGRARR